MVEPRRAGVLVVEDEVLIAMSVEATLRDLGFEHVDVAYNLAAARRLLPSARPVLGILDVNVGRELVFPLAAELRALRIPIVFSTGLKSSEFPPEWSGYPVLAKPLGASALSAVLIPLGFRFARQSAHPEARVLDARMGYAF